VTGGSDYAPALTTAWKGCHPKNDWILLGELDNYVPLSLARFLNIICITNGVVMALRGSAGEVITLTFVDPHMRVYVHKVKLCKSGEVTVSLGTQVTIADVNLLEAA